MSTATSFPISATNYDYNKRIQSQNPEKYVGLETAIFDNHYIQTWTERGVYYASFGSLTGGRDKQFYYFRNEAACNQWVQRTYNAHMNWIETKAKRREEGKKNRAENAAKIKVGDIFYTSCGYEQTNVDFFQVVEVSGQKVIVQQIRATQNEYTGHDSGKTSAIKDDFRNDKKIRLGLCQNGFQIDGHYANIWDGTPKYNSWGY